MPMSAHDDPVERRNVNITWEQAVATLLSDPEQSSLARDCYFDGTAVEAGERYWGSAEWHAARSLLPGVRAQALDVGAGRGIVSYALARDGWQVRALEPDSSGLVGAGAIRELAGATGYPIEVVESFGENLPFENEEFDLILARQALHHARDLRVMMRELYRVLRPGGRLVALRDHVISSIDDLPRFYAVHPLHRLYGGEHAFLLRDYMSALRGAGFSLHKVIAPLESPINYAPLTPQTLAAGIADQIPDFLGSRRIARRLLRSRLTMSVALKLLRRVDNRPGRLYSFVADRPGN
jgi:SAM-dependent methyltransferase